MTAERSINELLAEVLALRAERDALLDENDALIQLVGLLSRPRTTDEQVRSVRDELLKVIHLSPITERIQ